MFKNIQYILYLCARSEVSVAANAKTSTVWQDRPCSLAQNDVQTAFVLIMPVNFYKSACTHNLKYGNI